MGLKWGFSEQKMVHAYCTSTKITFTNSMLQCRAPCPYKFSTHKISRKKEQRHGYKQPKWVSSAGHLGSPLWGFSTSAEWYRSIRFGRKGEVFHSKRVLSQQRRGHQRSMHSRHSSVFLAFPLFCWKVGWYEWAANEWAISWNTFSLRVVDLSRQLPNKGQFACCWYITL